ncbi:hypothetical protein SDIAM103S_04609 [Streptomyces diastaticus subsp. diastaticus]
MTRERSAGPAAISARFVNRLPHEREGRPAPDRPPGAPRRVADGGTRLSGRLAPPPSTAPGRRLPAPAGAVDAHLRRRVRRPRTPGRGSRAVSEERPLPPAPRLTASVRGRRPAPWRAEPARARTLEWGANTGGTSGRRRLPTGRGLSREGAVRRKPVAGGPHRPRRPCLMAPLHRPTPPPDRDPTSRPAWGPFLSRGVRGSVTGLLAAQHAGIRPSAQTRRARPPSLQPQLSPAGARPAFGQSPGPATRTPSATGSQILEPGSQRRGHAAAWRPTSRLADVGARDGLTPSSPFRRPPHQRTHPFPRPLSSPANSPPFPVRHPGRRVRQASPLPPRRPAALRAAVAARASQRQFPARSAARS